MEAAELQDACAKRGITHGAIATATKSPWLHVWRVLNGEQVADYLGLQVKSWIYIWSGWRPVDLETQKRLLELFPGVEAQEVFVWEHKL